MQGLSQTPSAEAYQALLMPAGEKDLDGGPVPFFLAQSLTLPVEVLGHSEPSQAFLADRLGNVTDWVVEWKWDGIRAQALVGPEGVQLWSRGEDIVNAMFPELTEALADLFAYTGTACLLDGEILVWQPATTDHQQTRGDRPEPFSALQTRLGRKKPSSKVRAEAPAVFMAYDLLRKDGCDLRPRPFLDRRAALEDLLQQGHQPGHHEATVKKHLRLSSVFHPATWAEVLALRAQAGQAGTEGLMLKHREAAYGQGRQKKTAQGECWKWKRDPMSVDAVLVYAQRGHGRRAGLYTDYGFALWDDRVDPPALVPFAKAYSGLTDAEIKQVDQVIRRTILEKFGPVRQVAPQLVMELGFEGVMASKRHKSGFAVRFPRILRLRTDKPVAQADRLSALAALLDQGA
jgi:DNA ligase-1